MKAYEIAELYLNTTGQRGENQLREYVAEGGDINERDRDGTSALDIAKDTDLQDKKMRSVAPKLVEIIMELGGV
jgi:hypothetical protein